jgi:hypothetical protein
MMTGWKTWAAGGLMIAYGAGGYLFDQHGLDKAIELVGGGLSVWGLGHKLDKVRETVAPTPGPEGG